MSLQQTAVPEHLPVQSKKHLREARRVVRRLCDMGYIPGEEYSNEHYSRPPNPTDSALPNTLRDYHFWNQDKSLHASRVWLRYYDKGARRPDLAILVWNGPTVGQLNAGRLHFLSTFRENKGLPPCLTQDNWTFSGHEIPIIDEDSELGEKIVRSHTPFFEFDMFLMGPYGGDLECIARQALDDGFSDQRWKNLWNDPIRKFTKQMRVIRHMKWETALKLSGSYYHKLWLPTP